MRYRPELDGLRAFAAAAVVLIHAGGALGFGGWMGVDVFFALSGYLITSLLLAEHERSGRMSLPRFYARRALRLYPALLVFLLASLVLFHAMSPDGTLRSLGAAAAAAGLYVADFVAGLGGPARLGGLEHTWSLAVEEQFYLLWPIALVLLLRGGRRLLPWALGAAGVAAAIIAVTAFHRTADGTADWAYYLPAGRFLEPLLGCAVAIAVHRGVHAPVLERRWAGWGAAAGLVGMVALGAHYGWLPNLAWEVPIVGVLAAALVWHLVTAPLRHGIGAFLGWAPFAWVGRRSYGVYLWSPLVLRMLAAYVLPRVPLPTAGVVAATLALSIAVAALSYAVVERRFLRLKSRFGGASRTPALIGGAGDAAPAGPIATN